MASCLDSRLARSAAVGEEQPDRGDDQDDGHDRADSEVVHVEEAEGRRHRARGAEVQEQDADDGDDHATDDRPDDVLVHLTTSLENAGAPDRAIEGVAHRSADDRGHQPLPEEETTIWPKPSFRTTT